MSRQREHTTIEDYVDADTAFHRAVIEAAENPVLCELFDSFVPRVRQAMIDMLRIGRHSDDAADRAAHDDLAEAIASRDAETARRLSRDHLESLTRGLS